VAFGVRVRQTVVGQVVAARIVVGAEAVVDEVDVAEVAVVVVVSVVVVTVVGVAGARRARLVVRVAVRADDERVVILVVEPVVAAVTWIVSVEGVAVVTESDWVVTAGFRQDGAHGDDRGDNQQPIHSALVSV